MPTALEIKKKLKDGRIPDGLIDQVGAYVTARAQRAFQDQKFGSVSWKPRYPSMSAPKINIAGALADMNAGMNIRSNRFDDRPAGVDSGQLRNSISWARYDDSTVEIGSNVGHADRVHSGGMSRQPIDPAVTAKGGPLAKFLKKRPEFRKRLGFLFSQSFLETTLVPRPFIPTDQNFPDDMRLELIDIVEDFFNERS